jgi:hypothetical protein
MMPRAKGAFMIRIHADVIPWSLRLMKSQFAITEIPLDSTRGDMGRLEKTERIAEKALPIPFAH